MSKSKIHNLNVIFLSFLLFALFLITVGYSSMQTSLTLYADLTLDPDASAVVDDVYYASVQDAIDKHDSDNFTVTLLKDADEQVVIPSGKKITLLTNEHTLSSNKTTIINNGELKVIGNIASNASSVNSDDNAAIYNKGILYVANSNIISSKNNSNYDSYAIKSEGTETYITNSILSADTIGVFSLSETEILSIGEEGNIDDTTIISANDYAILKSSGVFIFNGGRLKSKINPGYSATAYTEDGYTVLTDSSGQYYESYVGLAIQYNVLYSPGSSSTQSAVTDLKDHGKSIKIRGRTFTKDGYIQSGWSTTEDGELEYNFGDYYTANSDITLYPVWKECNLTVGTNGEYDTIANALKDASTTCTLKLVSNVEENDVASIKENYSIKVDLNNYELYTPFNVTGNLTISDTSATKNGVLKNYINSTGASNLIFYAGTLDSPTHGIKHTSTGTINLYTTEIYAKEDAIEISSGAIVIGNSDSTLSDTKVIIKSTDGYGLNITDDTAVVSFYDGTITGNLENASAINGTVDKMPEYHKIVYTEDGSYQSAKLEPIPILFLYKDGEKYTSLTGGWGLNTLNIQNNTGSPSHASTYMNFSNSSTSSYDYPRRANFVTLNKIDLTGYKYIVAEWSGTPVNDLNRLYLAIYPKTATYDTSYTKATYSAVTTANARKTTKLDISAYQSTYHVGGFLYKGKGTSGTYTGKVYRIYLSAE